MLEGVKMVRCISVAGGGDGEQSACHTPSAFLYFSETDDYIACLFTPSDSVKNVPLFVFL